MQQNTHHLDPVLRRPSWQQFCRPCVNLGSLAVVKSTWLTSRRRNIGRASWDLCRFLGWFIVPQGFVRDHSFWRTSQCDRVLSSFHPTLLDNGLSMGQAFTSIWRSGSRLYYYCIYTYIYICYIYYIYNLDTYYIYILYIYIYILYIYIYILCINIL